MTPSPSDTAVALQPDVSKAIVLAGFPPVKAHIYGQIVTNSKFQYLNLRECTINKSYLEECKLDNCIILDNSVLVSSNIYNSEIADSQASKCIFHDCRSGVESVILDSTLRHHTTSNTYIKTNFTLDSEIYSAYPFYRNCKFELCDVGLSNIRESKFDEGSIHHCC